MSAKVRSRGPRDGGHGAPPGARSRWRFGSAIATALALGGWAAPVRAEPRPAEAGPDELATAPATEAAPGEAGAGADAVEPAPTAAGACEPGWEQRAFRRAVESVVRVETPNGWGAGFIFESPTTIVTALHVVEHGRWVNVVARDGEMRRARVIHNGDQALDLALLELEVPFSDPPAPIPVSTRTVEVGLPVLMIGHPGAKTGGWSVSWGRVGSETRDDGAIEVDGTVNPGNSGGPLLDCEGQVLGVVSYLKGAGITMAVPIGDLPRPGDRFFHAYRGAVATAARLPNLVYSREDGDDLWGVGLGLDVVLKSHFLTALQGHYQWQGAQPAGDRIVRSDTRWQVELFEEYRILGLGALGIGLGGALSVDLQRSVTGAVDATDPAGPTFTVTEDRDRSTRLRPMATVSWGVSRLLLSYAYQLDVLRPELSSHRVTLGLRMESVLAYE